MIITTIIIVIKLAATPANTITFQIHVLMISMWTVMVRFQTNTNYLIKKQNLNNTTQQYEYQS